MLTARGRPEDKERFVILYFVFCILMDSDLAWVYGKSGR